MGPLMECFFNGINCTLFAYGQTGSGKTHTLFGPPQFFQLSTSEWGVCPKVMLAALNQAGEGTQLRVQVVEIYLNECFDLLNNKKRVPITGYTSAKQTLKEGYEAATVILEDGRKVLAETPEGRAFLKKEKQEFMTSGTSERELNSFNDVQELMKIIEVTRSAKSHKLNERSSRSHCIVTL